MACSRHLLSGLCLKFAVSLQTSAAFELNVLIKLRITDTFVTPSHTALLFQLVSLISLSFLKKQLGDHAVFLFCIEM